MLKDSPRVGALTEAAGKKAGQEAPAETNGDVPTVGADGDVSTSGEMAPDGTGLTGENPESPDEDELSDSMSDNVAANKIDPAGDDGATPAISVPNEAGPLGDTGVDSVPPVSLPTSNMRQLPEPDQNQVKRRRGEHFA